VTFGGRARLRPDIPGSRFRLRGFAMAPACIVAEPAAAVFAGAGFSG
jgi:hypothetical protein